MIPQKRRLLGLTLAELKGIVSELGMPAFTAKQVAQWLYVKHVGSIDEMTNISKQNRELLSERYEIGAMPPADFQRSKDGTIKYLFPVCCDSAATNNENDNNTEVAERFVETVFIPDGDRATLCVSSQVGCKMNCLFCQTGKQGWHGNLTTAVDNLDSVMNACDVLTSDWGFAWSPKRITVSSVGIKGKLKRFLDESECHIAISLHSPLHEQRLSLMPAEKAMPIAEIVSLLKQYDFSHQRRCSFEYICFGGMNDSMTFAREILQLLEGLESRVNLIRFHEIPGVALPSSDERRMESLRDYLTHHGVMTTIRASRGQDILAACGMLSTARQSKNLNKNS